MLVFFLDRSLATPVPTSIDRQTLASIYLSLDLFFFLAEHLQTLATTLPALESCSGDGGLRTRSGGAAAA